MASVGLGRYSTDAGLLKLEAIDAKFFENFKNFRSYFLLTYKDRVFKRINPKIWDF